MSKAYELKLTNSFKKNLKNLPIKDQVIIREFIEKNLWDTSNPFRYDLDMKKLKGKSELYRYRIGKYRLVCQIEKNILVILLLNINKRDDNTYNFKY